MMYKKEKNQLARINRRLARTAERLRKLRGGRGWLDLGDFFVVDLSTNLPVQRHVNLDELENALRSQPA